MNNCIYFTLNLIYNKSRYSNKIRIIMNKNIQSWPQLYITIYKIFILTGDTTAVLFATK